MPENMLSDRARSARSENLHPQTQMSCHIATFAKDPGPVVSCHVATFAKNLGINDIDICPNPRDKYAQGKPPPAAEAEATTKKPPARKRKQPEKH